MIPDREQRQRIHEERARAFHEKYRKCERLFIVLIATLFLWFVAGIIVSGFTKIGRKPESQWRNRLLHAPDPGGHGRGAGRG